MLKKCKEKAIEFFKNYYSVFIVSFLALITVELLNHPNDGIMSVFTWFHTHTRAAFMNYVIYLSFNFLFYVILNRLNLANIAFFIGVNSLGMTNYFKLVQKGENLVFYDFFNSLDAVKAVTKTKLEITWQIVFVCAMICLVVLWQIRGHKKRKPGSVRLRLILSTFAIISTLIVGVVFNDSMLDRLYITNMDWNYDKNFKENGFVLCYAMNLADVTVEKPDNYNFETVDDAISDIKSVEVPTINTNLTQKPNIIAVMCESFADVSKANEGLEFSEEIMPNINALNENVIKGDLLVSIFGGGTANSEFEFLTGNSMSFLPLGSVAYNSYITENSQSIVGYLNDQGYQSIAIHPYDRLFWHRQDVYNIFGFEKFIAEEDFEDPIIKKGYISDESVYNRIIQEYENKNEGQPMFSFTVTMENHTPYVDDSNGMVKVNYDSNIYRKDKVEQVEVHARGIQDGDALLGDLVEYFSNVDEPTIVVFFGDHHPYISNTVNRNVETLDEVNKFKTQYVVWANYDIETNTDYTIDSSCLSSLVLSLTGMQMPEYIEYNLYGASLISGYNGYFLLDRSGNYYTYHKDMGEEINKFLENKRLIQYDLMFGNRYSEESLWKGVNNEKTQ